MNVLLAIDGSGQAAVAEQLVRSIGWPARSRITVVRVDVMTPSEYELSRESLLARHEEIRAEIAEHLAAVKRRLAKRGRTIATALVSGHPATTIVTEARRTGADLIVVGSRGHGAIASMVLGSVAAEVVDRAPCPVLVARSPTLSRIVVGDDGSIGSAQAEALLGSWTFLRRLPIHVVSVADLAPLYGGVDPAGGFVDAGTYQRLMDDVIDLQRRNADSGVARLNAKGWRATAQLREGAAASQLIGAAEDTKADLIVVGSRGTTGLRRLVVGSVARSVLFHAPVSVLVVRERAAPAPGRRSRTEPGTRIGHPAVRRAKARTS